MLRGIKRNRGSNLLFTNNIVTILEKMVMDHWVLLGSGILLVSNLETLVCLTL